MKKLTKISLRIAAVFIPLGIALMIIGGLMGAKRGVYINSDWKICLNESENYSFENYTYTGVDSISVNVSNANIIVEESSDNQFGIKAELSYLSDEPVVGVENGILKFEKTTKHSFNLFSFDFNMFDDSSNTVIIYVPKNSSLDDISLYTSNGRIELNEIKAKTVVADTSNGSIVSSKLNITEESSFTTSNGRIEIDGIFLEKTYIKTSNGKIIANGTFKGNTNLKTSNGTITFTNSIRRDDCDIKADTSNGSITIDGSKVSSDDFYENNKSENAVDLKSSNGNITVEFN